MIKVKERKQLDRHEKLWVKKEVGYKIIVDKEDIWYDIGIPSKVCGFRNPFFKQSNSRFPKAKCFALCGTINDLLEHTFYVVRGEFEHVMPVSRKLYFFANDIPGWYWNNFGTINVHVQKSEV